MECFLPLPLGLSTAVSNAQLIKNYLNEVDCWNLQLLHQNTRADLDFVIQMQNVIMKYFLAKVSQKAAQTQAVFSEISL